MTLHEIVASWLNEHGYDGLYREGGCQWAGCEVGDLMLCEESSDQCKAGYKGPCVCRGKHEFDIQEEKP